jgi:hypothetical protein
MKMMMSLICVVLLLRKTTRSYNLHVLLAVCLLIWKTIIFGTLGLESGQKNRSLEGITYIWTRVDTFSNSLGATSKLSVPKV